MKLNLEQLSQVIKFKFTLPIKVKNGAVTGLKGGVRLDHITWKL